MAPPPARQLLLLLLPADVVVPPPTCPTESATPAPRLLLGWWCLADGVLALAVAAGSDGGADGTGMFTPVRTGMQRAALPVASHVKSTVRDTMLLIWR